MSCIRKELNENAETTTRSSHRIGTAVLLNLFYFQIIYNLKYWFKPLPREEGMRVDKNLMLSPAAYKNFN